MPKIALIQQQNARNGQLNLKKGKNYFQKAAEKGAQVIAFAELGFSYFWPQYKACPEYLAHAEPIPGPATELFSSLAKEYGVVVVLNLFERDGETTYDSSPVIDSDGSILGVVRMVHIMDGMGFHEKGYYAPGDKTQYVFSTMVGRVGVAICYDRHYPEYMRELSLQQADIVIIPQAGAVGEWTPGIFEAEIQAASFQNGYFTALVNRVGREEKLHFAGGSFVVDPHGSVIARAPEGKDFILFAQCDFQEIKKCAAKRYFIPDRRPEFYRAFHLLNHKGKK